MQQRLAKTREMLERIAKRYQASPHLIEKRFPSFFERIDQLAKKLDATIQTTLEGDIVADQKVLEEYEHALQNELDALSTSLYSSSYSEDEENNSSSEDEENNSSSEGEEERSVPIRDVVPSPSLSFSSSENEQRSIIVHPKSSITLVLPPVVPREGKNNVCPAYDPSCFQNRLESIRASLSESE